MPSPEIRRDQWGDAATAPRSPRPDPPSPGAVLGSFVALIDHLLAAQTQLISSYLRLGSSAAHRSRPAAPTATTPHHRPEDDQQAPAPSDPTPAPATDAIAARAYEIFVRRGHEPGNPVDDWRRAEAELRAEMTG
jgi:hypothetical protein